MPYTPVAKRRGIDPSATRDRVLEAAEDLIMSGDFAQATVADLADKAGVARATVFSRFGSKLGVLETLAVRCSGGPTMRAIYDAVAVEDPVASLRALVIAACDHWELQGHILLTLKAVAELEPGAIDLIDNQRNEQRGSMEHIARGLGRQGRLRDLTAADLASIVAGRVTARTPTVLRSQPDDNVFVFIAGHGSAAGVHGQGAG